MEGFRVVPDPRNIYIDMYVVLKAMQHVHFNKNVSKFEKSTLNLRDFYDVGD